MPKFCAMSFRALAPTWMPILAKVVSQDWANAVISGAWPLPSPHASPWSLCRMCWVCGRVRVVGEATLVLIVVLGLWVSSAELVTILNVEPGGYVPCRARFSSGCAGSLSSLLSTLLSLAPSWMASTLGSKLG